MENTIVRCAGTCVGWPPQNSTTTRILSVLFRYPFGNGKQNADTIVLKGGDE